MSERQEWAKAGRRLERMVANPPLGMGGKLHIDPATGRLDYLTLAELALLAYFYAAAPRTECSHADENARAGERRPVVREAKPRMGRGKGDALEDHQRSLLALGAHHELGTEGQSVTDNQDPAARLRGVEGEVVRGAIAHNDGSVTGHVVSVSQHLPVGTKVRVIPITDPKETNP